MTHAVTNAVTRAVTPTVTRAVFLERPCGLHGARLAQPGASVGGGADGSPRRDVSEDGQLRLAAPEDGNCGTMPEESARLGGVREHSGACSGRVRVRGASAFLALDIRLVGIRDSEGPDPRSAETNISAHLLHMVMQLMGRRRRGPKTCVPLESI